MMTLSQAFEKLRESLSTLDEMQRRRAVDMVQWEYDELRHVFALLVLGNAVGLPAPPAEIGLGLLPDMEEELLLMLDRLELAHSPLSKLYSSLPVD
jgi:hypothetical protein